MKTMKYINTNHHTTYESVTLYNPDTPQNKVIAHFYDFHQATEFLTSQGYSIVYLEDLPQQKTQRWGVRRWN